MKPIIGLTMHNHQEATQINEAYVKAISKAGGVPLCIPTSLLEYVPALVNKLDGLLLIGGHDINPIQYNESPHPKLGETISARDEFEMALFLEAYSRNMPIFGICRGQQLMNVALGGTLIQDIPSERPKAHMHSQQGRRSEPIHRVMVTHPLFKEIFQASEFAVNSFHHQAVNELGDGLVVAAVAEDGVIEGLIHNEAAYCLSVQWHPEEMSIVDDEYANRLFTSFIEACIQ